MLKKQALLSLLTIIFSPCVDAMSSNIYKVPLHIIIPAYNEEHRIGPTLTSYCDYFKDFNIHLTVVLNGITDNTQSVVEGVQSLYPNKITILESDKGKGSAIKAGFLNSLNTNADFIGFVDADGSISPNEYYNLFMTLLTEAWKYDGVIASRYMEGSDIGAPRPFIKEYGRKLVYNKRIEDQLGLSFNDYQCGAKLFKRKVIENIAPLITESGWAIDLDILYLCKQFGFKVKEIPITWRDQEGSHLDILGSGSDLYKAVDRIKKKRV